MDQVDNDNVSSVDSGITDDDQRMFNEGIEEFFDVFFRMAEDGEVDYDEIGGCFPDDIRRKSIF